MAYPLLWGPNSILRFYDVNDMVTDSIFSPQYLTLGTYAKKKLSLITLVFMDQFVPDFNTLLYSKQSKHTSFVPSAEMGEVSFIFSPHWD